MSENTKPEVLLFTDADELTEQVADRTIATLNAAIDAHGVAHISITGGSNGIGVLAHIATLQEAADEPLVSWSAVHFWWGDERFLEHGDADRNETQAREALLDMLSPRYGLPEEHIHPMPTADEKTIEEAAQAYAKELAEFATSGQAAPAFDLMLLGMGPDAHVNSLFPRKDALNVTGESVTVEEGAPAELGPPKRVTVTFETVRSAKKVWLVVSGSDKAQAVADSLAPGATIDRTPAVGAYGVEETLWNIDQAAAEVYQQSQQ